MEHSNKDLVSGFNFTDAGRLVTMVAAADRLGLRLPKRIIDSYAYLLQTEQKLGFGYQFILEPLAFSEDLRVDLDNLLESEYISASQEVSITQRGLKWLSEATAGEADRITGEIAERIDTYSRWNDRQLLQALYRAGTNI